jgi:hypothetical protein
MRLRLPSFLRPFFWDYRFAELSWHSDRDLITARILAEGSWEAVCWLRSQLGEDDLRKWIVWRRGRGLSPKQLRFWEVMLNLPKRQVDAWLDAPQRQVWDRRRHA